MKPSLWLIDMRNATTLIAALLAAVTVTAAESERKPPRDQPPPDRPRMERPPRGREAPPPRGPTRPEALQPAPGRRPLRQQAAPQLRRLQQVTEQLRQARLEFRTAAAEGRPEPELRRLAQRVAELETERMLLGAQAMRTLRQPAPPPPRQMLRQRWAGAAPGLGPWNRPPAWRPGPWAGAMRRWWAPGWQAPPQPPARWLAGRAPRWHQRQPGWLGPGRFAQPLPPKPKPKIAPAPPQPPPDQPVPQPKAFRPDKPKDKPKAKPEQKPSRKLGKKDQKPKLKGSKPER
jgi:hypothetical protein